MAERPKIQMTAQTKAKKAVKRERVRLAHFKIMKAVEPKDAPDSIDDLDAEELADLDRIASSAIELWEALSS